MDECECMYFHFCALIELPKLLLKTPNSIVFFLCLLIEFEPKSSSSMKVQRICIMLNILSVCPRKSGPRQMERPPVYSVLKEVVILII